MNMIRDYINLVEDADAINDSWFSQGGFETFKLSNPVQYQIAKKDGVLKTLEAPVRYEKGHYIMGPGPKGEYWPLDPDNFHSKYDDNNDGTATPKHVIKIAKLADHDGVVKATWGDLEYTSGNDYIVRHGPGDYGVVKKDIFEKTYSLDNLK